MSELTINKFIEVSQLRVGLYVHLDLGWLDHSFALSNFKLTDEKQIAKISKIGLTFLRYDPNRSDCKPWPVGTDSAAAASSAHIPSLDTAIASMPATPQAHEQDAFTLNTTVAVEASQQAKQNQHLERLQQLHKAFDDSEKHYLSAARGAKNALNTILTKPKEAVSQAESIVHSMVDCALNESEVAIHAINGHRSNDKDYVHSINVTVLAMMMARSLNMTELDARILGMAALFHDIGKLEIPGKILLKKEPLTRAEQSCYEQHSELGARLAKQVGMPNSIANVILQHHELADGSGYPHGLKLEQINPLAKLVTLLSEYDHLCNPHNQAVAKTPYEALAYMFSHQRSKFDVDLLKRFIKSLGIYPPGSIVQLSNGIHGIVISVNPNKPLRPFVMLHDTTVDRDIPLILDLREEPSINIAICLKPKQLPEDALNYLNPRKRVSYFLDSGILPPATS